MKNINLKKKNSFGKIIGMKIKDYAFEIILSSLIFIGFAILIVPFFISAIPWWAGIAADFALILAFYVILLLRDFIQYIVTIFKSLSKIQYIPLSESEVKDNQLDTIEKYAKFINELITCDKNRCKIPNEIVEQVIEFSKSYYHTDIPTLSVIEHHNFDDYEVHNIRLMYEPDMNDDDFRDCPISYSSRYKQKYKKTFIVCDEKTKYNTKQMRDYLKKNPMLAEKWNLKLDADTTKVKLLKKNNNV